MSQERWPLVALIVTVFGSGVALILAAESIERNSNEFWGDISRDFGISLVIAGIVAMAFERYLRERLYRQIEGRIAAILDRFRLQALDAFELQKLPLPILNLVSSH